MEVTVVTSCDLIRVVQNDIACNRVFTLTLYAI